MWFNVIPLFLLFLLTLAVLLAAVEAGSWIAARTEDSTKDKHQGPIASVVTAILGLLAFILAFTFGMTESRFEQRRQLVLDEANAIQTAYYTSSLLPVVQKAEIRKLLRAYVETRLDLTLKNLRERMAKSLELQRLLWKETESLVGEKMQGDLRVLFIGQITQLFTLHQSRKTVGIIYRIPGTIWLSLYFLAAISMLAIGYQVGAAGAKRLRGVSVLAIGIACVITMIADIDRPAEGQFKVSEQPLRDVHEMMLKE